VSYFKKIVKKWSQKIGKLGPNSKNKHHIFHLENVLLEEGWTWDAINEFVSLMEAPKKRKPGEVWQSHKKGDTEGKPTGDWQAMNPEGNTDSFGDNKEKADKYANPSGKGDKEEPSGKLGPGDFERETEPERGEEPSDEEPQQRNISERNQKIIDDFQERSEEERNSLSDEQNEVMDEAFNQIEVIYDDDASDEEKKVAAQWLIDNVGLTTNSNKKKAYFNKFGGRRKLISGKNGTTKAKDLIEKVEALTGEKLGTFNARSVKQGFTTNAKPDLGKENIVKPSQDKRVEKYFNGHPILKRISKGLHGIYAVKDENDKAKMPSSQYSREYLEQSLNNPALQNVIDYAKQMKDEEKVDPAVVTSLEDHQTRMLDVLKDHKIPSKEAVQAIADSYNKLMVDLHKADPEVANAILKQVAENNLYEQELAEGVEVYLPSAGNFPAGDKIKGGTLERVTLVSCKWGKEGRIYGCPANSKTICELHQDPKKQNNQGQYEGEPGHTLLVNDDLIRVNDKKGKVDKKKTRKKTEEFITTTLDDVDLGDTFSDKEKKKIAIITTEWMEEVEGIRADLIAKGLKPTSDEYWRQFAESRKAIESKYKKAMGKVITKEHVAKLLGENNVDNVIGADGSVKPSVVLSMIEIANNIRTNDSLLDLEHNKQFYDENDDPQFVTSKGTQNPNDYSITFRVNRTAGRAGGGCQLSFTGDGTPPPIDLAADGVAVDHETGQEIEA
jgi:hypothetical protein